MLINHNDFREILNMISEKSGNFTFLNLWEPCRKNISTSSKRRGVKSQDSSVFEEAEEQVENTESKSEDKLDVETAETTADQLVPKVASPAPAQSEWDYFCGR